MLKKKIVVVILVLAVLIISVSPVSAYSVADIGAAVDLQVLRLSGTSSSSTIDLIFEMPEVIDEDITSTDSILLQFTDNTPHLGIVAGVIKLTFPSAEYVQGQSYNFSFKLNGSQSNNDTALLISPTDLYSALLIKFTLFNDWYSLGDTVPQWSGFYDEAFGIIEDLDSSSIAEIHQKLYNNSVMSFDFTLPSNYVETVSDDIRNNQVTIFFIMRTNYTNKNIYLSNFTLTPTGATKQLYYEQEHYEQVEEDLSNIQSGIENVQGSIDDGFSNVSGELEEGFSNLLELPEQEYDFGMQEGNDIVDSLVGAIDDKGPGFFSALGDLITTVSYSGTEAKWTFPALKIPKIGNIIPTEIKISEEKEIDFNYWIDKIPDKILSTIRYLLTIALICYCFYELNDTIEESLKGKEKKKP